MSEAQQAEASEGTPAPASPDRKALDALVQTHLKMLNDKLRDTTSEVNQVQSKFLFGGMLAVIALLNADLIVVEQLRQSPDRGVTALVVTSILVLFLSALYFGVVAGRLNFLRGRYRKTKHKYELTLYAGLLGADEHELLWNLEQPVDGRGGVPSFPRERDRAQALKYLHAHHGRRLQEEANDQFWGDFMLGMLVVGIGLVVKWVVYMNLPAPTP